MEKEFKLGLDCGATVVMGPVVEESKLVRRSFGGGLGTNCRSVSSLVKDWETHPGIADIFYLHRSSSLSSSQVMRVNAWSLVSARF